jgi:hypothetical protein
MLILFVLFYIVVEQKSIKINAAELVESYSPSSKEADEKFLNKVIELYGRVESYYEFENGKNILELQTESDKIGLYVIIMNKETEEKASSLTRGTQIIVLGKCIGLKNLKFPHSIYIEAKGIK